MEERQKRSGVEWDFHMFGLPALCLGFCLARGAQWPPPLSTSYFATGAGSAPKRSSHRPQHAGRNSNSRR
jgi:hypothetical protein